MRRGKRGRRKIAGEKMGRAHNYGMSAQKSKADGDGGGKAGGDVVYTSIGEMMGAAAEAAAEAGVRQYGFQLDYSEESLGYLDPILAQVVMQTDPDLERETKLWGGYFGETLRRIYGGEWELTQYPRSSTLVPTLVIAGSQLYPLMKVFRRLTLGEGERIDDFLVMVKARLAAGSAQS
jgi:hypothetical protein